MQVHGCHAAHKVELDGSLDGGEGGGLFVFVGATAVLRSTNISHSSASKVRRALRAGLAMMWQQGAPTAC